MSFLNLSKLSGQSPFFPHFLVSLAAEFFFFSFTLLLDLLGQHLSLKPFPVPVLLCSKLVHPEKIEAPMVRGVHLVR